MSERITSATLDNRCANLNRRLKPNARHVEWQGRNGHICLDEYRDADCLRTLVVGTKRQVADYLHAMMVGVDLSRMDA